MARVGKAVTKIAVEAKSEADDLDAIKADAHWKKASLTSAEAIEADPEYGNREKRWGLESSAILDDAAGMIQDPKMREKFKLQKSIDQNAYNEKFRGQAVAGEKEKKIAGLRTYLDEVQNRAIDPKRSNEDRQRDYADLDAYITYAEKKGLVDPNQSRELRKGYLKGTASRFAETLLDSDPETLKQYLEDLPAYEPQSNITINPLNDKLSSLTTQSGAKFSVAGKHADRFAGLLSDLEAAGLPIDAAQSGGYNDRNIAGTNKKSNHASGSAIDINWNENARGKPGKIRDLIPEAKIREIAKKHGFVWGGDWRNPDDMHFEIDPKIDPRPVKERGLTQVAGLSKPGTMTDAASTEAEDPAVTQRKALAKTLFGALDPEQRAKYLKAAKTVSSERRASQLYDIKRGMDGYTKSIEAHGEPAPGLDLEVARKTVDPRVWNEFENNVAEARATYDAKFNGDGVALDRMTEGELRGHIQGLVPTPETEAREYDLRTNVYSKTKKVADDILEKRRTDPASAVDAFPEVRKVSEAMAAGDTSLTKGDLVEARLAAQERLGLDPADRKPLTKVEAKALLDLPDNPAALTEKQYRLRLQSAADRAEQEYGPVFARQVFEAAVAVHVKDKGGSEFAAPIITKLARGEEVTREDYRRMNTLFEVDRVGSIFDVTSRDPDSGEARPFISPLSSEAESLRRTKYAKTVADLRPTPEAEAWIQANPDQWAEFDVRFGSGASARALAKAKTKTKTPPAR